MTEAEYRVGPDWELSLTHFSEPRGSGHESFAAVLGQFRSLSRLGGLVDKVAGHIDQFGVAVLRCAFQETEGAVLVQCVALHHDAHCLPDHGS